MSQIEFTQDEIDRLLTDYNNGVVQQHTSRVKSSTLGSGTALIEIDGRTLGLSESSLIVKAVCDIVQDVHGHIIIDLSNCKYLSSFALGSIALLAQSRRENGHLLIISGPNDMVRDVIQLSGLDESLKMCASTAEAEKILADADRQSTSNS